MKRIMSFGLFCILLLSPAADAKKKHTKPAEFDYYLLSLSWAPNFCFDHPKDHSSECKPGNHTAFVLHGLWPQSNTGNPPMSCKPSSPVAKSIADHMLQFIPTRQLIQHEWDKHGTCSGLSPTDYFAKLEQAFKKIQVPGKYPALTQNQDFDVSEVESTFAGENHAPENAFRISCHGPELVGLEVCLTKDLDYQACTKTVRECSSDQVLLRPPK